jgi:dihydrofolate reductase
MAKQCIEEELLDELRVHVAPFFLGDGVRLFDHPGSKPVEFERLSVVGSSSGWTHMDLRVKRTASKGSYVEYAKRT